ncbi:hypothetical protein B0H13DRAFT_1852154 [Mycena leptocephala]|nr:hypothetical protein B0H13DRAFT_1852154 [Mycena leptocephala]
MWPVSRQSEGLPAKAIWAEMVKDFSECAVVICFQIAGIAAAICAEDDALLEPRGYIYDHDRSVDAQYFYESETVLGGRTNYERPSWQCAMNEDWLAESSEVGTFGGDGISTDLYREGLTTYISNGLFVPHLIFKFTTRTIWTRIVPQLKLNEANSKQMGAHDRRAHSRKYLNLVYEHAVHYQPS